MVSKRVVPTALLAILLSACTAHSGYEWGSYSERAYQYKHKPTEHNRARYKATMLELVDRALARNLRVPPGIYAELAFLELEEKNRVQAAFYLRQEQQLYPESAALTQHWLNRIDAGTGQ